MPEENEIDYVKLGLKSGLEIHQQLDTRKLFCNCPSVLRKDEPDFIVKRKLHAIAGESGEVDVAAKYQASLDKEFIYQGYDSTCLVELDEEPPHKINLNSLRIALHVAILLNAKILPLTQIMRKTVIDGSNTGGFQRTVLVAVNGYVETEQGRIGIESICLEEDAARIIERKDDETIYRLDRLGIPLIEIATAPDIKNPEQAKEVALHLGKILRSLKVKRGIGTIRQDVNVSIKGGNRVEIKGFQDPSMFVKTIDLEIERQRKLINENKKVEKEVRKALPNGETEFLRPMPGAARMYPETDLPLLKISREVVNDAKRTLPKLRGDIEEELKGKGLNDEMVKLLFKENKLEEFKHLLKIVDNPEFVSKVLLIMPREIAGHEKKSVSEIKEILNEDILVLVLESLKKNKISKGDVRHVLERIVQGKSFEEAMVVEKEDVKDVEEKIIKLIKGKPGLNANAYMGLIMKEFKGKVSGKEVMEIIRKYVG